MTLAVAFLCHDGVLVATDSMITNSMGQIGTTETKGKKTYLTSEQQVFAFAGDLGYSQRFRAVITANNPLLLGRPSPIEVATMLSATAVEHFQSTGLKQGANVECFFGFVHSGKHHCAFFNSIQQPRLLDSDHYWMAIGSGKLNADPFLAFLTDTFIGKRPPSIQEAMLIATWALEHVIRTNTGGVNAPIQIAVLRENPDDSYAAEEVSPQEIDDQLQAMSDAIRVLQEWRDAISGMDVEAEEEAPPPPRRT